MLRRPLFFRHTILENILKGWISMKIIVGGKEINLVDRDVKLARKLVRKFLMTAKKKAEQNDAPTFFLTLLVVTYLIAHDYLTALTPKALALLLNAAYQTDENTQLNDMNGDAF